jgi:hypothetical protein
MLTPSGTASIRDAYWLTRQFNGISHETFIGTSKSFGPVVMPTPSGDLEFLILDIWLRQITQFGGLHKVIWLM